MRYNITPHCGKRYKERVLQPSESIPNLYRHIILELKEAKNITSKVSTECPRYILYLKERYGGGINILEKNNVLYFLRKQKGTSDLYDVVTCYNNFNFLENFKNTVLTSEEIHHRLRLLKH